MIRNKFILSIIFLSVLFSSCNIFAQRKVARARTHRTHHRAVVIKSVYRPAVIRVYHPIWQKGNPYHRRWVFFPRLNFYWDNWREVYVVLNNQTWIATTTPPVAQNSLADENNYELKEKEDDLDDIFVNNETHIKKYKVE